MKKQNNRQLELLRAETKALQAAKAEKAQRKVQVKPRRPPEQGTDYTREYKSPKIPSQIGRSICQHLKLRFPGIRLSQQSNWTSALQALDKELDWRVDIHTSISSKDDTTTITIQSQGQKKELRLPNSEAYKKEGEHNWNYLDKLTIETLLQLINKPNENHTHPNKTRTQKKVLSDNTKTMPAPSDLTTSKKRLPRLSNNNK